MDIAAKQISSLIKIRSIEDLNNTEINKCNILSGEEFSYQLAVYCKNNAEMNVDICSEIADYVRIYSVKDTAMDFPANPQCEDEDYLTRKPGLMPDLLLPLNMQNNCIKVADYVASLWVSVLLPSDFKAGKYDIDISLSGKELYGNCQNFNISQKMTVNVLPKNILPQKTIFTQWFHVDCIAMAHNTQIYSETHWDLIDKYMQMASQLGINMLLTPVFTPPLDTKIGSYRPNTQLVRVEKNGETYSFDFTLLKRWINLCKKNKIKYFEISHFYSQWGLKYSPSVVATVNGEQMRIFGWHMPACDKSYTEFLSVFIPKLTAFLEDMGVKQDCFFHLSDEPKLEHIEAYRNAYNTVKPLIGDSKIMDALSSIDFYEKGLLEIPVTATNHIEPFLEKKIEHQWAYYCCCQDDKVGNRFMSMPSYRNRILGLQLYKYNIEGFLQWGYNFYLSQLSLFEINPYVTSSAEKAFPSGDPFSVYPGNDGPLMSLRAVIFKEALQDIEICTMAEMRIGKEKVIELIENEAGMEITFTQYPRNNDFIPDVMDKLKKLL